MSDKNIISEATNKLLEVREEIDKWDDLGYKPNIINNAEKDLNDFFKNHSEHDLTESEADELNDILDNIQRQDYKLDSFEAKFEKAKGKRDNINTIEEYAEFVDKKTVFENEILSSSKLSYYDYEELQKKAKKTDRRRTWNSIDKMIEKAYLDTGKTGDDLYDYVYDRVSVKPTRNSPKAKRRKSNRRR